MEKINLAIVGATGLVGSTFLKVLSERKFKLNNLYLFASAKSNGKKIIFNNQEYSIETLTKENIINKKIDYALFSAGSDISKNFAKFFNDIGCVVIDNSSAFRMEQNVPLIVPQINGSSLMNKNLIANPNCSTIQSVIILDVINKLFNLEKINYVTLQAVSGSGIKGLNDLKLTKENKEHLFYPYSIANNCLPHIGNFLENGYSSEEIKMTNETKKILNNNNLHINATCIRVPLENCHSIEIDVKTKKKIDVEKLKKAFTKTKNIIILDDPQNLIYPINEKANNTDFVYVGRIRKNLNSNYCLSLYVVADNIRIGAASNAIDILEYLINKKEENL